MLRLAALVLVATLTSSPGSAPSLSNPELPARAFLARWLELQNSGRFDNYERLYALDFDGLLLSGDTTKPFDHDAWLEESRRMFREGTKVAADDMRVAAARSPRPANYRRIKFDP